MPISSRSSLKSQSDLASLWDESHEAVLVEAGETIVYANRPYAVEFGYENPVQLIGQHISVVLSALDGPRMMEYGRSRLEGGYAPNEYHFRGRRRDGTLIALQAYVDVIEGQGQSLITTRIRPLSSAEEISSSHGGITEAAFADLYDRYAPLLHGILIRMLKDRSEAQDVFQEAFFQAWRERESYSPERGSLTAWLVTIARSRAIDRIRKRRLTATHLTTEGIFEPVADKTSEHQLMVTVDVSNARRLMSFLPAPQRQVLELAYFDGKTQSEIASQLGVSLGTVKTRVILAVRKLRNQMGSTTRDH